MAQVLIPSTSAEDWKRFLADPEKQWRKGYSARTLAYCWHEAGGFPDSVRRVFLASGIGIFQDVECLLLIPEHKVDLPGGTRPSQNDIWVLARSGAGLMSMAVEGKVSEPFGPTVGEWLRDAWSGKLERMEFLKAELGIVDPISDELRYQLLHRAASAVIEAKRYCAQRAVLLVHSFSQTDEWLDDYCRFASLFGANAACNTITSFSKVGDIHLYGMWVRGEARYLEA